MSDSTQDENPASLHVAARPTGRGVDRKIAVIALLISGMAMLGTGANAYFTIQEYMERHKTALLINCDFRDSVPVKLVESPEVQLKGRGALYAHVLILEVGCRVTNVSSKRVSIEAMTSEMGYGPANIRPVSPSGGWRQGIFEESRVKAHFPRSLDQGDQARYIVEAAWLVDSETKPKIETVLRSKKVDAVDLHIALIKQGIDLNVDEGGTVPRAVGIRIRTADGYEFRRAVRFKEGRYYYQ